MRLGIFGGSFNPIHMGHVQIVKEVLKRSLVDHVEVVPAFQNPLKNSFPEIPELLRMDMLKASFEDCEHISISNFELQNQEISYTYKTLRYFHDKFPRTKIFLILGEDAFSLFPQWYRPDDILQLADLLVFYRPNARKFIPERLLYSDSDQVNWIPVEIPSISSTRIRQEKFDGKENISHLHPKAKNIWKDYKLNISHQQTT